MASALAFPQHQQNQALPVQTVNSGSVDNSLLSALASYITTGDGAQHTTQDQLQELVSTAVTKPGGKAYLEALVQTEGSTLEHKVWQNRAAANGNIDITKTTLDVNLNVPTLKLSFSADGAGFFVPYKGSLNAGTIYYNDFKELTPGDATFELHVHGLSLHVKIYRNQVYVATFYFKPVGFVFPPGGIALNGKIV